MFDGWDIGTETDRFTLDVQPGDIWALPSNRGDYNHYLYCGDSTNLDYSNQYLSLFQHPDMVWADVPYGIGFSTNWMKEERLSSGADDVLFQPIDGDGDVDITHLYAIPKGFVGPLYVCTRWDVMEKWRKGIEILNGSKLRVRNVIIWVKSSHGMGDLVGAYGSKYEMVLFAHGGGFAFQGKRPIDVWDLGSVPTGPGQRIHPMEKPVSLLNKAITDSTKVGDVILDPYAGSFVCLVAAEELGRVCHSVEISTIFCRGGLLRYWNRTGRKPVLVERVT